MYRYITALRKELPYKRSQTTLLKLQIFERKERKKFSINARNKVYSNKLDWVFLKFLTNIFNVRVWETLLELKLTFLQIISGMSFWNTLKEMYLNLLNIKRQIIPKILKHVVTRKYSVFKITRRSTFFEQYIFP